MFQRIVLIDISVENMLHLHGVMLQVLIAALIEGLLIRLRCINWLDLENED